MAPIVDQLSLGPIGTNCYVVRADSSADEAVVVDPSGDVSDLELALRTARSAVRRDPPDARPLGSPRRRRRPRRREQGAGVHGRGRAIAARGPEPLHPFRNDASSAYAGRSAARRRDDRHRRPLVRRPLGARSFPGASSPTTRTGASSPVTSSSRARSDARTFPEETGTCWSRSIRSLMDTLPSDTVVYPGHGPTTTLGDELARNPFLAELRAERSRVSSQGEDRATARDARRRTRRSSRSGGSSSEKPSGCARSTATGRSSRPCSRTPRSSNERRVRAPTSCRRRCTRSRIAAVAR